MRKIYFVLFLFFSFNLNAAHDHQGKIPKIAGKPVAPKLTDAEQVKLDAGESIYKVITVNGQKQGLAVQDIQATPDAIWNTILNFKKYPKMVDKLKETEVYAASSTTPKVRFKVGSMGIYYEYYIKHRVNRAQNYVTWHLDYTRDSEIDDSVGFWLLEAHPTKPGVQRVYYSLKMLLKGWVPGAVKNYMQKQGIKTATKWVKKYSEK